MQFTEGGTARNSDSDTLRYVDFVSCDVNVQIDIYCTYYAPIMLFNSNSQVRSIVLKGDRLLRKILPMSFHSFFLNQIFDKIHLKSFILEVVKWNSQENLWKLGHWSERMYQKYQFGPKVFDKASPVWLIKQRFITRMPLRYMIVIKFMTCIQ